MVIVADETGSFRDKNGKSFGIVTLVTVTDKELNKFHDFMTGLFPNGFLGLKGKYLDEIQLEKVLKYIGSKQEIKYTSFLYDLTSGNDEWVDYHKRETIRRAKLSIEKMGSALKSSYVKDINLYLNQLGKYSVGDYAKFIMFTELFIEWQRFFQFDYINTYQGNDSWRLHHIIDTQNEPNKFIRLVQSTMILTTSDLNPNYSVYTPKEWIPNHPLIKYLSKDGDITLQEGHKFYEDFRIGDEKIDEPLLLPDLIGYVIMCSIINRRQKRYLLNLKRLMANRSLTIKSKDNFGYYLVRGFDRTKTKFDVNPIIQEHHKLMKAV